MANIINKHILEYDSTKSIFGNFRLQMESANARPGELITTPIESFERHEEFLDWSWFHTFNTDFFNKGDKVLWVGSCIAEDFADGFESYTDNNVIRIGQGVNSFRSQEVYLRWLFDEEPVDFNSNPPWDGYKDSQYNLSKRDRQMMLLQLHNTNKVVLFTGTTELIHDSKTGLDMPMMPPMKFLDRDRHVIRRISYEENIQSLRNILQLLEKHLTKDVLFITTPFSQASQSWEGDLPPVPLTFEQKAHIKSALSIVSPHNYFPMYEMIYEYFPSFRDKGTHIHNDITVTFIEMLKIWYSDFDIPTTKKEFMTEFLRRRKSFVQRALESRALPRGDVPAAKVTLYQSVDYL